jgi:hypothetical protein
VAERLAAIATLLSRKMFNARRESCEQIFYGEFDGRHRKRVLVKSSESTQIDRVHRIPKDLTEDNEVNENSS